MERTEAIGGEAIGAGATPRAGWLERALARVPDADRLTIAALLMVVLMVSVPLLRTHSLRQNEMDALRSLSLLAAPLHGVEAGEPAPATIGELCAREPDLLRRLTDAELLDGGRVLRRHGYLFDLSPAGSPGPPLLRAWPWAQGRTGLGAFVLARPGEVLAHPNRGAHFSGPAAPPAPTPGRLAGWFHLPLAPDAR